MNEYETASLAVANANLDVAKANLAIARDGLAIAREGIDIAKANLAIAREGIDVAAGNMLAAIIAAAGIWVFGIGMLVQNWRRAKTEQRRAEAEKNRHTESMEAEKRRAEAEQRRAEADERRHTESMTALTELIRRTSPTSPPPGPAE